VETIEVTRRDGIVTVTLNRPHKKNAMTPTMWEELLEVFEAVESDRADRVLVITGAADAFCSGADLTDASGDEGAADGVGGSVERMRLVTRCALTLHELRTPTLAAVNGVAAGAGLNLALGCDIVIASERARFSEIFSKRGLSVDFGGSWLLPRLVGLHRAKELVFLADIIDATEAERIGLVNRVVAHDRFAEVVEDYAQRLAALPPIQIANSKRMLNQSFAVSMAEALEVEGLAQALSFQTKDTVEAIMAFIQKREPHFEGR
jgi:enoyl-CoA hydratase/carnithine racemase